MTVNFVYKITILVFLSKFNMNEVWSRERSGLYLRIIGLLIIVNMHMIKLIDTINEHQRAHTVTNT